MSNIQLSSDMEIETKLVAPSQIQVNDYVATDDLIYQVTEAGGLTPMGVPVWSQTAKAAVTGRTDRVPPRSADAYFTEYRVITLVR